MKSYSADDLATALRNVGIRRGDMIYFSTQLFGLGKMRGESEKHGLASHFYQTIRAVIGEQGTLVVPAFTQRVGRFGTTYVHETTESETGIFSEFVRGLPGAHRSLHPVFSVCAIGPAAAEITEDVSAISFGHDSAFDRMYRLGGKTVCAGFPYYSGYITSLIHYVETKFAVPYYYNKYVVAEVWKSGQRIAHPFVINVRYLDGDCEFDFSRYTDAIADAGELDSAKLGSGSVHAVDIRRHVDIGLQLLKQDMYAFLVRPPRFVYGRPPLDGPPAAEQRYQGHASTQAPMIPDGR